MLRNKAGIVFLGVCLGIGLLGIGVFHGRWAASTYPISRQVKYSFTLRNTTSRVIPKAEFWTYAPVKNTSTQLYVGLKSSHPYEFVTDAFGNQDYPYQGEPAAFKIMQSCKNPGAVYRWIYLWMS